MMNLLATVTNAFIGLVYHKITKSKTGHLEPGFQLVQVSDLNQPV